MNFKIVNLPVLALLLIIGAADVAVASAQDAGGSPRLLETAARLVQTGAAPGGICAVVGSPDAELAMAIAKQGSFVVQNLSADAALLDAERKAIRARGLYGTVAADLLQAGRLPYTENLVNLVIVDGYPAASAGAVAPDEVLRVLAPLGVAYFGAAGAASGSQTWTEELAAQLRGLGAEDVAVVKQDGVWVRMRKPWPAEIDEWTHYLHGADGNPVARDRVVGPPKHYQWISDPTWQRCHETDSSVSTLVTARGRLFYISDEAPISLVGDHPLPDKWFLVARDAFNGVPLWKVPIRRWGWREWKSTWFDARPGDIPLNIQKRLVAVGDKIYVTLGYQAPVSELDARSGEVLRTYAGSERTNEILYVDGTLILSVLDGKEARVMAFETASGKQLWTTPRAYRGSKTDYIKWKEMNGGVEPAELDPALNLATDGRVVALLDGPEIAGVDFRTGRGLWHTGFPLDEADRNAGGINAQGNLWVGTMIVRDGVVVHASPYRLAGLAADSGKLLWNQPKRYIGHLWYEWKDVFVIDGLVWTWSAELDSATLDTGRQKKERPLWPQAANGYDIHSGELKKSMPVGNIFKANHHHRCYRDKATEHYIITSRRGSEYVDLVDGHHTVDNWVRGTCHVGMMPANGLQYAPPHPCACYIDEKLSGMNVLAPERPKTLAANPTAALPRFERGPAYEGVETAEPGAGDWPEFRHDSMRTGAVPTRVPDGLAPLWRISAGKKVSPPTVVAGRVFVALIDEQHVACHSAADGAMLWEFAAGGRIDSQPTYYKGRLLFGSADGWVYCLRAADGQLAWRFRGAPESRLIGAFGQLESAWPVHGSVLVQNGVAYFAAGRSSHLDGGVYLYGVDAASGKLLHQTTLAGPSYTVDDVQQNCGLPMGCLSDILLGDGSRIYMRTSAFDGDLKSQRGRTELQARSGLLDDTYFKRTPWTFNNEYGRLIVHDKDSVYYVRMFDSLRGLDPTVFFTPGGKGYLLFAKNMEGKRSTWSGRVPVRIRAMALTTGRLFVAGPPDVVDPKDPLGAFENRKGGVLYAVDSVSGEKRQELALPFPPVFNGAAAAGGRLFLTEEDGSLTCLGSETDHPRP